MRVSFGSFVADTGRRALWRDREPVALTPKAFRLLEILLERRPNAVSQKELYDELWPDTFVELANLHNLVSQLRMRLADDDHTLIRTVYGFGFSFDAETREEGVDGEGPQSDFALLIDGTLFPLRPGSNVVGRSPDAEVPLVHRSVSRHHARVSVTPEGVEVEDLGSHNGTFVNSTRIGGAARLGGVDRVRFGGVEARLITGGLDTESFEEG